MKAARFAAVGIVVAAVGWIASGHLFPRDSAESRAAARPAEAEAAKLFRVAVMSANVVSRSRKLVLSGRTEADRKMVLTARVDGAVSEIKVRRGSVVKEGDVIAVLSDEAREARVLQARAMLIQRKTELAARMKLIEQGTMAKLEAVNLETQFKSAEASLAAAEAEKDRSVIRAPWAGIINDVPVEIGQAVLSFMGKDIAQIVSVDPVLAVVEVAERNLSGVHLGDKAEIRLVTGATATGKVRFISKTASAATRTYRVDVEIPNADGAIPDGITAEVAVPLAATSAVRVPRSALTFASGGDLGVRIVDAESMVAFVPVTVVEDEQQFMWVGGVAEGARIIVQGQDFVREGQKVEPVEAEALQETPKTAAR
jgi:multidrug efflux system membrane fusion protein